MFFSNFGKTSFMEKIISFAIVFFVCISLYTWAQYRVQGDGLNNKTFTITLTQTKGQTGQRKWSWQDDEITFKDGKLISKTMNKHEEFPAAVYSVTIDSSSGEKQVKFQMVSQNHFTYKATIKLNGTITGDVVEGTAEWISVMGTYEYTFTGAVKH